MLVNVLVNNQPQSIEAGKSLFDLLDTLQFAHKKGVAIAVNEQVIMANAWASTLLNENDKILIISAAQGG